MIKVQQDKDKGFLISDDGTLRLGIRLCVLDVDNLWTKIMEKAHYEAYNVHSGATKMYHNLGSTYWWNGMKRDVVKFVYKFLTCQQV